MRIGGIDISELEYEFSNKADKEIQSFQQPYTSKGRVNFDLCGHCNLQATSEGHDGCLGTINSSIWNACCGHGLRCTAYIQFSNSSCIRGEAAISIIKFLKPSITI